jgi:hypothetical protein
MSSTVHEKILSGGDPKDGDNSWHNKFETGGPPPNPANSSQDSLGSASEDVRQIHLTHHSLSPHQSLKGSLPNVRLSLAAGRHCIRLHS